MSPLLLATNVRFSYVLRLSRDAILFDRWFNAEDSGRVVIHNDKCIRLVVRDSSLIFTLPPSSTVFLFLKPSPKSSLTVRNSICIFEILRER